MSRTTLNADFRALAAALKRDESPQTLTLLGADSRILRLNLVELVQHSNPHANITCLASWRGRRVFAKLFRGRRGVRSWEKSIAGTRVIQKAGVPTPALLHAMLGFDRRHAVALFEYLDAADDLATLARGANDTTLKRLADCLIDTSLAARTAGRRQGDDHPNNYLFKNDRAWMVDTEGLRRAIGNWRLIGDWRKLIARANIDTRAPISFRHHLLSAALAAGAPPRLANATRRECARRAQIAARAPRRRIDLGDNLRGVADATLDTDDIKRLIELSKAVDAGRRPAQVRLLKHGGTNSVLRIQLPKRTLIVKRYPSKSLVHRLMHALMPSRARRSFLGARVLAHLGVARTPESLAFVEECRFRFLPARAWLITENHPGETLAELIQRGAEPAGLDQALLQLLRALTASGAAHGDLKATNLIVDVGADPIHADNLWLTDLDALRFGASRRRLNRDRRRLLDNWPENSKRRRSLQRLFENESSAHPAASSRQKAS